MRKPFFGGLQTTKVQTTLHIHAFRSVPFVIRSLESIISRLALSQIASVCSCDGWFETHRTSVPGRVAQSVTCLATDASLTADPGVASSIPARSHTFVEIDHEIISTVILLPSAESFKKGCCQLQAKVCARSTG